MHARESRREKPEGGYECNVSYQLEGEEGGERGRQTGIETVHLKQSAQMSHQSLGHESAISSSED